MAIFISSDGWMRATPMLSQRRAPLGDVAEQRHPDEQQHPQHVEWQRDAHHPLGGCWRRSTSPKATPTLSARVSGAPARR